MSALPGALLGLAVGSALLLVLAALLGPEREPPRPANLRRASQRRSDRRSRSAAVAMGVGSALVGAVLGLVVTGLPVAALLAGVAAGLLPAMIRRRRAARQRGERRAAWPEAVDTLASGVRAGLALPEAVAAVAVGGPEALRAPFAAFGSEYRARGSFPSAVAALREEADDAVADRVAAALSLAWASGGTELGVVLRTLGQMLREDARTRAEIEARQSWTVAAARMAVAAPFATLVLLATRPEAARAYASATGAVVITVAAVLSAVAYALMRRIARLPEDRRSGT